MVEEKGNNHCKGEEQDYKHSTGVEQDIKHSKPQLIEIILGYLVVLVVVEQNAFSLKLGAIAVRHAFRADHRVFNADDHFERTAAGTARLNVD